MMTLADEGWRKDEFMKWARKYTDKEDVKKSMSRKAMSNKCEAMHWKHGDEFNGEDDDGHALESIWRCARSMERDESA